MTHAPSALAGNINANINMACATLIVSGRQTRTPEEKGLEVDITTALEIPWDTWAAAVKVIASERLRLRQSIGVLVRGGRVGEIVAAVARRAPTVATVLGMIREWARLTADDEGPACWECRSGVGVGLECTGCSKVWHFGCAWRAMEQRGAKEDAIIPQAARFAKVGLQRFGCLLCRHGDRSRATRSSLLERLRKFVDDLEVNDAWTLVEKALDAGPTRRRLPGSGLRRGGEVAGRYLAIAAVASLAAAAEAGDRSAELLLLFAPRLFMRKGERIEQQIADMVEGVIRPQQLAPITPERRWSAAAEAALDDGNLGKLAAIIERGPSSKRTNVSEEALRAFYPAQQKMNDEGRRWKELRARVQTPRDGFTATDLRKWARKHPTSSGGSCGWTGALILHVCGADAMVGAQLARLWSRQPEHWHLDTAARAALRLTDGWPIPKENGGCRPIAAPQVMRRIGSAALMKRARPLTERYCRERWQFGLSGEAQTLTYSLIPLLTATAGGTVLVADRSQSFQTIGRDAVLEAVTDVIEHALPSEQGAAAALLDACLEFYSETDTLPKSTVEFDGMAGEIVIDGLPQGCSLSPTLEAIVLAWHHRKTATRADGVCGMTAHDDMVVVGQLGTASSDLRIPSCQQIGGSYNTAKSVAYGALRSQLVSEGKAASEREVGTIWGRPVGRLDLWYREVWLPKFRARCERIRHLAKVDAAVAIWSAHALKGPGSMAAHALRGIPPAMLEGDRWGGIGVMAVLGEADTEWVHLIMDLAGVPQAGRDAAQMQRLRMAVFGSALGHVSAAEVAKGTAAAGLVTAFPFLMATANAHGLDVSKWAVLMGLPQLRAFKGVSVPADEIVRMQDELRERAKTLELHRGQQSDNSDPDPCGTSIANWETNLWVEALGAPGPLHVTVKAACGTAGLPETRATSVQFALARILHVPVWPSLARISPTATIASATACGLCQTATSSAGASTGGGSAQSPVRGQGVRAQFDDQAEHVSGCLRTGPTANNRVRHDRLVKVAAEMGLQCGFQSRVHDGPIFDIGPNAVGREKRPADWFEQGSELAQADASRYFGGRCCDLTIRTGNRTALDAAVKEKEKKYEKAMEAHKHMALTIFGIGTSGVVSKGADETFARWAGCLARHRRATAELLGCPRREVTRAFGLAYATVTALQVAAYANDWTNASRRTRNPQTGGSPPAATHTEPRKRNHPGRVQPQGSQGLPQKMNRPALSGAQGNSDIGYVNSNVIVAQDGTESTTSVSHTLMVTAQPSGPSGGGVGE